MNKLDKNFFSLSWLIEQNVTLEFGRIALCTFCNYFRTVHNISSRFNNTCYRHMNNVDEEEIENLYK